MASQARSASEAVPQGSFSSIPSLIGEWIRQGTEGFIATQKILLDLAAQQNALALTIIRERLGRFPGAPSKAAIDLAGRGIRNFMEAQQVLLDMAARQNSIVAEALRPGFAGTVVEGLAEVVYQGLDNLIHTQKQFLTIFESQTDGAVQDYRDGKGFDTSRLSELAREELRNFLHSQKKFLDIVEQELTVKKEPKIGLESKRVDIFEMAKQSVDAFVELEKKMLDLASDQVDVNVKFVREIFRNGDAKPTTTLPELLRKSVDSFVVAQKALAELASKPRQTADITEDLPIAVSV